MEEEDCCWGEDAALGRVLVLKMLMRNWCFDY